MNREPWLLAGRLAVALEASGRPASVAVAGPDGQTLEASSPEERNHASDLLPLLEELLGRLSAGARDIQRLVVGLGPGSYTGLRVAAAAAQGLGRALGVEVLGLPSIEARLYEQLSPGGSAVLIEDARGGRLTLGRYRRDSDDLIAQQAVMACTPAVARELVERWCEEPHPPSAWFAGSGALEALGFEHTGPRIRFLPAPAADAAQLLALAERRYARWGASGFAPAEPLYLAPFTVR